MDSGIIFRISFFEAFFKCHYTKKYRLSYPIPLPTSIAGMIGSILGLKREEIPKFFSDLYLGSKVIKVNLNFENITLLELDYSGIGERSVEKILILNEPEYEIAVAGNVEKIDLIKEKIRNFDFKFLPFGGQNDFFVKNIKLIGEFEVEEKNIASGYFPKEVVEKIDGEFWILPVKYKGLRHDFIFVKNKAILKERIKTVGDIALYSFENFEYVL